MALLRVGDRAADFAVPAVDGAGTVGLSDFTGRQSLFLGLYRGLHCPFCRRHLAQLDLLRAKLEPLKVATVAIVNTPLDRARLYFRTLRGGVRIGADPERTVHHAYAVPKFEIVEPAKQTAAWPVQTTIEDFLAHRIDPTGELDAPTSPFDAVERLNVKDGFQMTPADGGIAQQHGTQLVGMFLIDRDSTIRWRYLESEGTASDLGRFPTPQQIVDAAGSLPR